MQIPLVKGKNFFLETGAQFARFSCTNMFRSSELQNDNEVWLNLEDGSYMMDYGCKETYTFSNINVPVLFGYEFAITDLFHIDLMTGPVVNVTASAKLDMDGYSNCEIYTYEYGIPTYYGYANSTYTGNADLMTGKYEITQKYSTGEQPSYTINNYTDPIPAYKRINASWRLGANIGVGPVALEVCYDFGLTNMADAAYWENARGARVPGMISFGEAIPSDGYIKDYSQKLGVLTAGLSVRF